MGNKLSLPDIAGFWEGLRGMAFFFHKCVSMMAYESVCQNSNALFLDEKKPSHCEMLASHCEMIFL